MEKEKYILPEIEVIELDNDFIITTSKFNYDDDEDDEFDW